jgi:hypothetical protein
MSVERRWADSDTVERRWADSDTVESVGGLTLALGHSATLSGQLLNQWSE